MVPITIGIGSSPIEGAEATARWLFCFMQCPKQIYTDTDFPRCKGI